MGNFAGSRECWAGRSTQLSCRALREVLLLTFRRGLDELPPIESVALMRRVVGGVSQVVGDAPAAMRHTWTTQA